MLAFRYLETEEIKKRLVELEALRLVFEKFPPSRQQAENLRRESLLKSSVFSARIEGNPLTVEKARWAGRVTKDIHKREIFNLLRAYSYLNSPKVPKRLTLTLIRNLHRLVMRELSANAGRWRNEPWAVFDQSGGVVHLAPPPFKVATRMNDLVNLARSSRLPIPVLSALIQFLFEKIHPFADGNGRVGRLLSAHLLKNSHYDFGGLISFEEFLDQHRERYYQVLLPAKDATAFVEFFLEALISQAQAVLDRRQEGRARVSGEDVLLPRRREILNIVRDHPYCSFDFIARRFLAVNRKTLHYDLAQLIKRGFVVKIGVSRGVVYKAK